MTLTEIQVVQNLLYWAKLTCEEVEAQTRNQDEPPSWLPELRAACDAAETEQFEALALDGQRI
ncbi:hypothetical protein [Verrucomicrobium spinosum]|uniref:hypothetical protein n=1 Tax=Verrucomicrobium spinosum TaxID=2736 RepID=UPI0001745C05|nr:hypothetical protein [Verrucomicrobium spinosum]